MQAISCQANKVDSPPKEKSAFMEEGSNDLTLVGAAPSEHFQQEELSNPKVKQEVESIHGGVAQSCHTQTDQLFTIVERNQSFHQNLMDLNFKVANLKSKNKALKQYFVTTRGMIT